MGEKWSRNTWLPFTDAREVVRDECIASVSQYYKWWNFNRPAQIPKYPYNVWKKEWVSWNDFLGNDNTFDPGSKEYRPYPDAIRYVHNLQLRSQRMWFDYVRDNDVPDNIPRRPEMVYKKDWISWNHWLGNKASARVAVQQAVADNPGVLYIVHLHGRPANVVRIGIVSEVGGLGGLGPHSIVKLYQMEHGYDWEKVVSQFGSRWWENDAEWMISNINELLFELGSDLLFV